MNPYPNLADLVLASGSPRRRELLASLGVDFTVRTPEIDETPRPDELPRSYAERLAKEKAAAVQAANKTTVIAADTIVVQDSCILGKPEDENHARDLLHRLSGRSHEVITAVSVRNARKCVVFSVGTEVRFRTLTPEEVEAYVATGCPMDKAGAYAIQGGAAHMVRAISGSYTNVVGLPLCELHETLLSF